MHFRGQRWRKLEIKFQLPGSNYQSQVEQKIGWDAFSQGISLKLIPRRRGNKYVNLHIILGDLLKYLDLSANITKGIRLRFLLNLKRLNSTKTSKEQRLYSAGSHINIYSKQRGRSKYQLLARYRNVQRAHSLLWPCFLIGFITHFWIDNTPVTIN